MNDAEMEKEIWELIKTLEYHAEGTGEPIDGGRIQQITILKQNLFAAKIKTLITQAEKRGFEKAFKEVSKGNYYDEDGDYVILESNWKRILAELKGESKDG